MNKTHETYESRPHVLVVDDDRRLCDLVSRYLNEQGFVCAAVQGADEAFQVLERLDFDALVVDVMMPGMTGLEFSGALRQRGQNVPVLFLTALGEVDDRIRGLEAGGDDYLPKPFEPKELVLRLQAILRRAMTQRARTREIWIGPWQFLPEQEQLADADRAVYLTAMEVALLRALAAQPGVAVSREILAEACGLKGQERAVDVHVTRLRRKIETNTRHPRYLQTVRGKGYLLRIGHAREDT
ncbi:MAG: response regulator transcription factor [Alphaproteobacteria bacterium]|nr:response regulator transcription factor [Alphaproteobacteria bacterium]